MTDLEREFVKFCALMHTHKARKNYEVGHIKVDYAAGWAVRQIINRFGGTTRLSPSYRRIEEITGWLQGANLILEMADKKRKEKGHE
jgi:hypothetical protein